MKNPLAKIRTVGLDTNIFIYFFNQNSPFYPTANQIFDTILKDNINSVTSIITCTELFSFRVSESTISNLEQILLSDPNLTILEVNMSIAKKAAEIRRNYRFTLADSIQLATALVAKAVVFITNDARLKSFKELKVILLSEF